MSGTAPRQLAHTLIAADDEMAAELRWREDSVALQRWKDANPDLELPAHGAVQTWLLDELEGDDELIEKMADCIETLERELARKAEPWDGMVVSLLIALGFVAGTFIGLVFGGMAS